jgi:hypothetical protein
MDPINLEIVFNDGETKNVSAVAFDLMRFEQHFDMSIAGLATPKLTHLFYLAYSVESRTKATDLDFEAWVSTIQAVKEGSSKK